MGQPEISNLWQEVQEWIDKLPYPPSQAKLARRLGVGNSTVHDWKYGVSSPGPEALRKLADEMIPVEGRDIAARLLEAVNKDQGYLPSPKGEECGSEVC